MKTKDTIDAFHAFQIQSNLLTLHLQLAEGDDKPKRSGDFESTYKSKSGVEITVERSSDGKFATKAGSGAASATSEPVKQAAPKDDDTTGGNTTEIVKNLLNGDLGKQLKKSIVDGINKNSAAKDVASKIGSALNELNIKTGVQQAQFSEILGKGSDAIGNAQKYIKSKFDDIGRGASDSETCKSIGKILVAGLVVGAVAGVAAVAMGASGGAIAGTVVAANMTTLVIGAIIDSARISKRNADNFKNRFAIAAKKDYDAKFTAMIKQFDDEASQKKLLEDIKTVAEFKREEANPAPKVDPPADNAAKAELAGASGASLKNSLIAGAAENPNIAAGIEATKMIDVVSGSKDFFSNTKQFVSDKLQEAATATSEKAKDMAIGGAIVGAIAAASATAKGAGEEAARAVSEQVTKLLSSTDIDEKLKAKLESATPQSVKDAIANTKLFMTDALIRKVVIERTKAAIVKAVTDMKAKIESGEATESVFTSAKDLSTRVKELGDRMNEAAKQLQEQMKDATLKQKSAQNESEIRKIMGLPQEKY